MERAKQALMMKKSQNQKLTVQRQSLDESVNKMVCQNEKTRKENDETQCLLVQAKK